MEKGRKEDKEDKEEKEEKEDRDKIRRSRKSWGLYVGSQTGRGSVPSGDDS